MVDLSSNLQFDFKNQQEVLSAQKDSIFTQNGYEADQNGNPLLFNSEGHKHNLNLRQVQKLSKKIRSFSKDLCVTYDFPKDLTIYVRSKQNKELYRLLAIQACKVLNKI